MKNSHTFSRICGYAMFLLILAQIVLVLASWLITAAMPDVFPRSLLSPEGIRWFFGTFTANLQSPWLVWLGGGGGGYATGKRLVKIRS